MTGMATTHGQLEPAERYLAKVSCGKFHTIHEKSKLLRCVGIGDDYFLLPVMPDTRSNSAVGPAVLKLLGDDKSKDVMPVKKRGRAWDARAPAAKGKAQKA